MQRATPFKLQAMTEPGIDPAFLSLTGVKMMLLLQVPHLVSKQMTQVEYHHLSNSSQLLDKQWLLTSRSS